MPLHFRWIPFLGLSLCVFAAPPAEPAFEGALRTARENGIPWILIQRAARLDSATKAGEELLQRLRIENQLQWTLRSPAETVDLARARGWVENQPHWVLLSAQGEEVADGAGLPSGETLLGILRDQGLTPRWEMRQAFLKEHPDHGEARAEDMRNAMRLVGSRLSALVAQGKAARTAQSWAGNELWGTTLKESDPQERERQGDLIFGDLAEAMEGLSRVPRWEYDPASSWGPLLTIRGGSASPRLRQVCGTLAEVVAQDLLQEGPDFPLELHWLELRTVAGPSLLDLPEVPELPWAAYGSPTLVFSAVESFFGKLDWQGALAFLEARSPQPPPAGSDAANWEAWRACKTSYDALRVSPLWHLGRRQEALATLEAVRALAGPDWKDFQGGRLLRPKALREEKPILATLQLPPLPAPAPPPQLPPVRLVLLDGSGWRKAWEDLHRAEPLLPWSPQEIQWTVLSPRDSAALRARAQWDAAPRWAMLRGEALLAAGTQCPQPEDLAALLTREAPSRLQILDRFLEQHPAHRQAHLARLELLLARMPEPRLESFLAADARAASLPASLDPGKAAIDFGPDASWKPDEALWQWSAQQMLPQLEAQLRAWPTQAALWRAWLAWARFHPSHPSPFALANTLPLWADRSVWIGRLPLEVHLAVATELRRTRAYPELATWMEAAWAQVREEPGAEIEAGSREDRKTFLERLRPAIVDPLAESLRLLQRPEEARQVERTFNLMTSR